MIKNISGFSTALFSTWYFVDDLGILFDCGDGVTAHLLAKSRKIKHIFISHPDRDHITGLSQVIQLNAREGFPKIYYPKDSGSFPAMKAFFAKFDPHVTGCEWIPLGADQVVEIKKGLYVKTIRNEHVECAKDIVKSLSYQVFSKKKKLKEPFLNLDGSKIKELKQERGEEALFDSIEENIISFSGDTPITNDGRWNDSKILIHEATFLEKTLLENDGVKKRNLHSTLEGVMKMLADTNLEHLILGHFSIRYNHDQIIENVEKLKEKYEITFPVSLVLPGQFVNDILQKD